jgi:hypothetical protein
MMIEMMSLLVAYFGRGSPAAYNWERYGYSYADYRAYILILGSIQAIHTISAAALIRCHLIHLDQTSAN